MKTVTLVACVVASIAILPFVFSPGNAEVRSMWQGSDKIMRSPGKISAPVTLVHSLDSKPAIGEAVRMDLVFATADSEPVVVEVNASEQLGVAPVLFHRVRPGQTLQLQLVPQEEGRFYVNVVAQLGFGTQSQAKVFVIPVQIGAVVHRTSASKAAMTPNGEFLIRMQAVDSPARRVR